MCPSSNLAVGIRAFELRSVDGLSGKNDVLSQRLQGTSCRVPHISILRCEAHRVLPSVDVEKRDVNSRIVRADGHVIEPMELKFCRSRYGGAGAAARNRTNCVIPKINGSNLTLRVAARRLSCHRVAARRRQRRRPHETSAAAALRRSGPRAPAPRRSSGLHPTRLLRRSWLR